MKMLKITLFCMILATGLSMAQFSESQNVMAELISEFESIKPGEKFWVALKLEMEPEWHTYWRNPGDAGLPTEIDWSLPEGFTVSDIHWPYPEIFETGGVVSYGYKNGILLLSEMTSPENLSSDDITIEAEVTWLECKELCLPGSAQLSLILPVVDHQPEYDNKWTESFIKTRDMLPIMDHEWTIHSMNTDSSIVIKSLTSNRDLLTPGNVLFFPYDEGIYNNSKPQVFNSSDTGFTIEVMYADFKVGDPEMISGILKIETSEGNSTQTVEITVPITTNELNKNSLQ